MCPGLRSQATVRLRKSRITSSAGRRSAPHRSRARNTIGAPSLAAVWVDPDFDPNERAFYCVRVIEIPPPRWTAYDARFFGIDAPAEIPMVQQNRAYTSPIWYTR